MGACQMELYNAFMNDRDVTITKPIIGQIWLNILLIWFDI